MAFLYQGFERKIAAKYVDQIKKNLLSPVQPSREEKLLRYRESITSDSPVPPNFFKPAIIPDDLFFDLENDILPELKVIPIIMQLIYDYLCYRNSGAFLRKN